MFQTNGTRTITVSRTNPGSRYSQNRPWPVPGSSASLRGRRLVAADASRVRTLTSTMRSLLVLRDYPEPPRRARRLRDGLVLLVDDLVDAVLVLGAELLVHRGRVLGAVDELLQTGVQLVVEGRRGPVGVVRDAVSTGEGVEVRDELLRLLAGDVAGLRRDGHTAVVADQGLDLRGHRDVDELLGETLVLGLLGDHPHVAGGTGRELGAREE